MDDTNDKYFLDTLIDRLATGAECLNRLDQNCRVLVGNDFYMIELRSTDFNDKGEIDVFADKNKCVQEISDDLDCLRSMLSFMYRIINIKKNSINK